MEQLYEPELGQLYFGPSWASYECPRYVKALLFELFDVIRRTYWNRFQETWDGTSTRAEDPQIPGISYKPFYYHFEEEQEEEEASPNFQFEDVTFRWYKHPGRGLSTNKCWEPRRWVDWFYRCFNHIETFDPALKHPGVIQSKIIENL